MLQYPSVPKNIVSTPVYAFDKLDGSNIRVEWSRKAGFCKFGSRTRLLDPNEKPLGEAVELFHRDFADPLEMVCKELRTERVTFFLEFYGDSSFAGLHDEDEEHRLSLFDVSLYKRGFMLPKEFLKTFEGVVPTPELLYHGNPNADFIEEVKTGVLEGMTFEGVVCKAQELRKGRPVTFKVKNQAWLQALKDRCAGDEALFERLA